MITLLLIIILGLKTYNLWSSRSERYEVEIIQFSGLKRKITIYTLGSSEDINFIIYGKFCIFVFQ